MDSKDKKYYGLKGLFSCDICNEFVERSVLYIYGKLVKDAFTLIKCTPCLNEISAKKNVGVAKKRWEKEGTLLLIDKLPDLVDYWNYEKNEIELKNISLTEVNSKKGLFYSKKVHLYCYICKEECERSLRTVLNNHSKTGHSWILCDTCKSKARMSKAEILCLLVSEYCNQIYGMSYQFQYKREDLLSDEGFHLFFDFAFFLPLDKISFILEIQGGFHYEKHFSETQEHFKKRIKNDYLKQEYCVKHNLPLIELKYQSPTKKELRRIQLDFEKLLVEKNLIPNSIRLPDFSDYASYITLEYQKRNANHHSIKNLISYIIEGNRIEDLSNIELIKLLFSSDKKYKTAYNRAVLNEIVSLLTNTNLSIKEIRKITKVPDSVIRRMNNGEAYAKYTNASKTRPLRKLKRAKLDKNTILNIVGDLKNTNDTYKEIAKRYNVSESVPKAINDGSRYSNYSKASKANPIRLPIQINKDKVLIIAKLLKETDWSQKKIAEHTAVTVAIVQKINTGYNHSNITQASSDNPLRKRKK